MGLGCPRSRAAGIDRVSQQETMEISASNLRHFRGARDIAARLLQEAQDRLPLELPDNALLRPEQPLVDGDLQSGRLLDVEGKMPGLDGALGRQHYRPLHDVLELPQISRPRVPLEEIERL